MTKTTELTHPKKDINTDSPPHRHPEPKQNNKQTLDLTTEEAKGKRNRKNEGWHDVLTRRGFLVFIFSPYGKKIKLVRGRKLRSLQFTIGEARVIT